MERDESHESQKHTSVNVEEDVVRSKSGGRTPERNINTEKASGQDDSKKSKDIETPSEDQPTKKLESGTRTQKIGPTTTAMEQVKLDKSLLLGIHRLPNGHVMFMTAGIKDPGSGASFNDNRHFCSAVAAAVDITDASDLGAFWYSKTKQQALNFVRRFKNGKNPYLDDDENPVALPWVSNASKDQKKANISLILSLRQERLKKNLVTDPVFLSRDYMQNAAAVYKSVSKDYEDLGKQQAPRRKQSLGKLPADDPKLKKEFTDQELGNLINMLATKHRQAYDRHLEAPGYFNTRGQLNALDHVTNGLRGRSVRDGFLKHQLNALDRDDGTAMDMKIFRPLFNRPDEALSHARFPDVTNSHGEIRKRKQKTTKDEFNSLGQFVKTKDLQDKVRELSAYSQDKLVTTLYLSNTNKKGDKKPADKNVRVDEVRRSANDTAIENSLRRIEVQDQINQYTIGVRQKEKELVDKYESKLASYKKIVDSLKAENEFLKDNFQKKQETYESRIINLKRQLAAFNNVEHSESDDVSKNSENDEASDNSENNEVSENSQSDVGASDDEGIQLTKSLWDVLLLRN